MLKRESGKHADPRALARQFGIDGDIVPDYSELKFPRRAWPNRWRHSPSTPSYRAEPCAKANVPGASLTQAKRPVTNLGELIERIGPTYLVLMVAALVVMVVLALGASPRKNRHDRNESGPR